MSIENPQENSNVVDLGAARKMRQGQEGTSSKQESQEQRRFSEDFAYYKEKFLVLNREFEKILQEEAATGKDATVVRRQIEMNSFEIARLLHVTARYVSYEAYLKKVERMVEIFHLGSGDVRKRANRNLQEMQTQLSEFLQVFKDYGIQDEQENIKILQEKVSQGFLKG